MQQLHSTGMHFTWYSSCSSGSTFQVFQTHSLNFFCYQSKMCIELQRLRSIGMNFTWYSSCNSGSTSQVFQTHSLKTNSSVQDVYVCVKQSKYCTAYSARSNARKRVQTQKRFKRTLFIRTKHNTHIFGVNPFMKLQNDT